MRDSASKNFSFSDAISAQSWLSLALAVDALLQDPEVNRLYSRRDVIEKVADGRSASLQSIERPLKALSFLKDHYPHSVEDRGRIHCGFVSVLELEKLHQLSPGEAGRIAGGVIDGSMSLSALKRVRAEIQDRISTENPGKVVRALNRKKVMAQERELIDLVVKNQEVLSGDRKANVELGPGFELLRPDIVITTHDGRRIVVEVKTGTNALRKWNYAQVLGQLSLYERIGDQCWLVVPDDFEGAVRAMSEAADKLEMETQFAMIDESGKIRKLEENRCN